MRLGAIAGAFIVTGLMLAGTAAAEKVKTNQKTKMYAHPGEAGEVLMTIKTGQNMTVLSKEGRWLKVRFEGRTGYIPRSKVDLPDDDGTIQRNTRRRPFVDGRSMQRGPGGEGPDDRVGADAVGDGDPGTPSGNARNEDTDDTPKEKPKNQPKHIQKPDKDKDEDADPPKTKDKTKPKGTDRDRDRDKDKDKGKDKGKDKDGDAKDGGDDGGGDDGGDGGKDGGGDKQPEDTRPRTHVTVKAKIYNDPDKASDVAFTAEPAQELFIEGKKGKWTEVSLAEGDIGWVLTSKLDSDDAVAESGGGITKRTIDLQARLGGSFLNQALRSPGSPKVVPPDNYNIATPAVSVALGGDILFPYKKDFIVGGELAYQYDGGGGVAFMGQTTGISIHDIDIRAIGGYDLHNSKGMVAWAHLGFRYQAYLVANVANPTTNTALLPSEIFTSPTIGGGLTISRLTPKIAVLGMLDLAVLGTSLTQTKNLDDGTQPHEIEVAFKLGGTYRYKPGFDFQAFYDLTYGSASFGPLDTTSQRQHMGTGNVTRLDLFHTVSFGILKTF
jgi:hypothetical protein